MHGDCDGKELESICTQQLLAEVEQAASGTDAVEADDRGEISARREDSAGWHVFRGLAGIVGSHMVALLPSDAMRDVVCGGRGRRRETRMDDMD